MTDLKPMVQPGALEELPIFPLPGGVLFPHALLPLHVFEPRYRAMVEHCVTERLPLGVVMIKPGHEDEHLGRPPLLQTFGIGRLIASSELDDGRFFIMLRGMVRAQLIEELEADQPFRVVRARVVAENVGDAELLGRKIETIRGCLSSLVRSTPAMVHSAMEVLAQCSHPAELADKLSEEILTGATARQHALEVDNVGGRLDLLIEVLLMLIGSEVQSETIN